MGTRGAWGWRLYGEDKLFYCHYDSYPAGLGEKIVAHCRTAPWAEDFDTYRQKISSLIMGDTDVPRNEEILQRAITLGAYNPNVSGEHDFWYQVTRNTQGDPDATLALGAGPSAQNFLSDSLFCEYAYIINLDDMVLECHRGFNTVPNAPGRYAKNEGYVPHTGLQPYYGVMLVGVYRLGSIPTDWENCYQTPDFSLLATVAA